MSSALPLILITGVTGYVGGHVLQHAIDAGYPVRVTARPGKAEALAKKYEGKIDVVEFADLVKGDYSEALKGVGAIVHVAAPLAGKEEPASMIQSAVEGGLNIVRQAVANGINKIVITSSFVTAADFDKPERFFTDYTTTENDWNPATREQVLSGKKDAFWVYCAVKILAEREIWKFADAHPEVDITTINPPFIYGPVIPGTKISKDALPGYSTFGMFASNLLPAEGNKAKVSGVQNLPPTTVDVRDVARAHILALRAPHSKDVGRKRLFIAGEPITWKAAVEHLLVVRPHLRDRLPDVSEAAVTPIVKIDSSKARELLGLEFTAWQKTVEDTIDSLLIVESEWKN